MEPAPREAVVVPALHAGHLDRIDLMNVGDRANVSHSFSPWRRGSPAILPESHRVGRVDRSEVRRRRLKILQAIPSKLLAVHRGRGPTAAPGVVRNIPLEALGK
jgi:hypothetical protein